MIRLPRRLALRMKTLLVLVAALAIGLSFLVNSWRHGDFAFQREHAGLAAHHLRFAELYFHSVEVYAAHEAKGHLCPRCSEYGQPASELRKHAEALAKYHQRQFRWHSFLAGPAFNSRYDVEL